MEAVHKGGEARSVSIILGLSFFVSKMGTVIPSFQCYGGKFARVQSKSYKKAAAITRLAYMN